MSIGLAGIEKSDAALADQHGDCVLILGACNAEIGGQRLRALQRVLRLDDGNLIRESRLILSAGESSDF